MQAGFHTFNIKNIRKIIFSIALPLLVGFASAWLGGNQGEFYSSLVLPPLAPPPWLFSVAWAILYILMGISKFLVSGSQTDESDKRRALVFYYLQLAVNFFWSILFFRFQLIGFSFLWIVLLLALVIITAVMFYDINRAAGWLMLPYIAWLAFAAYLNYMIWVLN